MKAHTRLMSLGFLIAAKAFAAVPVGPAPIAEVMTELRRIESASATGGGQVDILRLEYKELARNRPSDPLPRVYIAWCSLPSDDSWNELKSIAAINPDSPWAHLGMGRIYTGWKMRDQARAEFAQILARDAKFFPALSGLGDFARANNDEVGAEKAYRDSLAIADDAWAHAGLGFLFQKQAKLKEAAEEFRKSLNTFPSQPQVLNEIIGLDRT